MENVGCACCALREFLLTNLSMTEHSAMETPSKPSDVVLEAALPPSRRHPHGASRCQAVTGRDGALRQCRRKARDGYRTCMHHGAGSKKREQEGKAQSPAFAALRTGERAKPETLRQLVQERPALAALYAKHLNDDDLLDLRPVLAQAKALSEWLLDRVGQSKSDDPFAVSNAAKAIQALAQVMRAADDMLRVEERLGPITHSELRRLTNAVAETVRRFVPEHEREQALAFLRASLGRADPEPGS